MADREQKVKELMAGFQSLKHCTTFRSTNTGEMPKVTPSQWGVLMLIEEFGERTVKDIADTLSITSSAATQLIDGLVKNGYVVRETNKEDRRTARLVLSKKTGAQVKKMKKQVLRNFLELFDVLDDKEFNQYLFLNKKMFERFSKK